MVSADAARIDRRLVAVAVAARRAAAVVAVAVVVAVVSTLRAIVVVVVGAFLGLTRSDDVDVRRIVLEDGRVGVVV